MKYTLVLHPQAQSDLKDIPARYRRRLINLINGLAQDPYPARSKQLEDPLAHLRRLPLDQWRVIYDVMDEEQEVNIYHVRLKTGPETYEDLD